MKNFIFYFLAIFIIACNQTESDEVLKLRALNDSISNEAKIKDDAINDFLKSFNDIEENLSTIKEKEKIITITADTNSELKQDAKDRINEDIQTIYQMLTENKKKLNSLNKKLKNANIKISELENMIANMTKQLNDKNTEILELKDKLEKMNIQIAELTSNVEDLKGENVNLNQTVEAQTTELNTAFYVFGTEKELKENKVITKEGGFIGLGKIEKLMEDFNKDYFSKIDITKTKKIDLYSKKARLITSHPATSYKIYGEGKADSLVIKNPSDFWGVSKYLVIVVD